MPNNNEATSSSNSNSGLSTPLITLRSTPRDDPRRDSHFLLNTSSGRNTGSSSLSSRNLPIRTPPRQAFQPFRRAAAAAAAAARASEATEEADLFHPEDNPDYYGENVRSLESSSSSSSSGGTPLDSLEATQAVEHDRVQTLLTLMGRSYVVLPCFGGTRRMDETRILVDNDNVPSDESSLNSRRQYCSDYWFRTLPVALFLGVAIGLFCWMFWNAVHAVHGLWWNDSNLMITSWTLPPPGTTLVAFWKTTTDDQHQHQWIWWLLTCTFGGGTLGGLALWLIPGAPPLGTASTFVHDLVHLNGNPSQVAGVVVASGVAMACGAQFGPELAMGSMATGLASFLATNVIGFTLSRSIATENDNIDGQGGKRRQRKMEAIWCQSALAAAFSCFLPSPILGPLLVHELSLSLRPRNLPIDSILEQEGFISPSQQHERNTNSASDGIDRHDHDYLEVLGVQAVSSLSAFAIFRWLQSPLISFDNYEEGSVTLNSSNSNGMIDFNIWYLLSGIPMGILCGALGASFLVSTALFRRFRCHISSHLVSVEMPLSVVMVAMPTLAGFMNGVTAIVCPYSIVPTLDLVKAVLGNSSAATTTIPSLSSFQLMAMVFAKLFSTSASLGLGLLGGPLIPLSLVGLCLGVVITALIPSLPLVLTVSCCVAACPAAICPLPMTASLTVLLLFPSLGPHSGAAFVACTTAWALTGGVSILGPMVEKRVLVDARVAGVSGDHAGLFMSNDGRGTISEDEYLRGVRSAIFGGA